MEKTVKISIIIPVYNVEEYLEQCLNSILEQSLTEIEAICIDDGSKDSSYEIIKKYSEKDDRVKCFHFEESRSALQARKLGVLNATGEYIMFLDADDYLETDACMKVYEKITSENVDILHFLSRVENCANLPESRIQLNERIIRPYEQRLEGEEVFNACFIEKKYMITLWNKVFRTELCKKAFEDLEDQYLPKAQDLYSFFAIAYHAKSYMGWISEPLHNYCIGRGVVGSRNMDLDKFERYCTQANIVKVLKKFSIEKNIIEKCEPIIEGYFKQWIKECVRLWDAELPKEDAINGLDILYEYWGVKETIACISELNWNDRAKIANKLSKLPKIDLKKKDIKTIAIYYYHYTIGGVQRVISLLAPMLKEMGYRVVIITDVEDPENEFPLPEGIFRANIYNRKDVNEKNYEMRIESWDALTDEYQIDLMLYNAWTSQLLLWDLMYLKKKEIGVIVHSHSVFSYAVNKLFAVFYESTRVLALAEGIVTLSESDKVFWDAYNKNVYHIPNPVSNELLNAKQAKWDNKALIWLGRVAAEKQPKAIFEITEKVASKIPEVKVYLVGNFTEPKWKELAKNKGIEENIVFCGEIQNVNDYYEKSSICISTSKFEGFSMVLLEAQAHGMPAVMFNMPNLTLGKKECGVVGVDMKDCMSAAKEIEKLLLDKETWEDMSSLALESYRRIKEYDFKGAWKKVIEGANTESYTNEHVKNMIHTFVDHYNEGLKFKNSQNKKKQPSKKETANPNPTPKGKKKTFLQKIKGILKRCREKGILSTTKYVIKKIYKKLSK